MNWYKYWYYTIFFIYDSFNKNRSENNMFSVGLFSATIYSLFATMLCLVNRFIHSTGILSHLFFHMIYIVVIYLFNGFLFWSETKSRKDICLYRESNTSRKNIVFIVLTVAALTGSFVCVWLFKADFVF